MQCDFGPGIVAQGTRGRIIQHFKAGLLAGRQSVVAAGILRNHQFHEIGAVGHQQRSRGFGRGGQLGPQQAAGGIEAQLQYLGVGAAAGGGERFGRGRGGRSCGRSGCGRGSLRRPGAQQQQAAQQAGHAPRRPPPEPAGFRQPP